MDTATNTTVMILVGGLGTRLASISGATPKPMPKPMMGVGGQPFLEYLILSIAKQGFRDVIFCTGHQGEAIEEYFRDGAEWDVNIRYSPEPQSLGTGGALKYA